MLADLQRTDASTRGDVRRLAEALRSLGLDDEAAAPMLAARRFHLEILEELTCLHGFDAESRAVTVSVLPTKPVMLRDLNLAMRKFSHRTVAQVSWLHNQLLAVLVDLADGRKELVPALRAAFKAYKSPIAGFWEEQLRQCFIAKDVFARDAGDFDAAEALKHWPEEYFEPLADQLSTKPAARPLIQAIAALYEMVAVITDTDVDFAGELAAGECRTDEGDFASKAARTVVLAARRASSIRLTFGIAASVAQAQKEFDAPALAAHLLDGTFFVDRHTYRNAVLAVSRLQSLAANSLREPDDGILRKERRNNYILVAAMPFFENLRSWVLPPPPKEDENGQFLLFSGD